MRSIIAAVVVAAILCGPAHVARAQDRGSEMGYALTATAANLGYTPFKVLVAAVYLPVGAVAGLLGGGDTRAQYALWVPFVGGDYFVTADHIAGRRPLEFLGHDYADTPSRYGRAHFGSAVYDAGYVERMPCAQGKPCCQKADAPCRQSAGD
jgi:hypothetical protein